MTNSMTSSSHFKDLNEFLAKHSAKNEKPGETPSFTHTRMPDKDLNIYPGSYLIPREELATFYNFYYDSIFVKKRKEYLTEKQLDDGRELVAVDFDFRYSSDVTTRQHTREHVSDMVCEYAEVLKGCYLVEPNKPFDVFIMEKPNVNRLADCSLTKDGIHMLICLQVDHAMQMIIRDKMMAKLEEIWDLPLINTWDSVLDSGISTGKTNWTLYGSRKPGHEAYELTHHYIMSIDPADGEYKMDEEDVINFDLRKNFARLSVQYENHPKFEINPKIIDEYNKRLEVKLK